MLPRSPLIRFEGAARIRLVVMLWIGLSLPGCTRPSTTNSETASPTNTAESVPSAPSPPQSDNTDERSLSADLENLASDFARPSSDDSDDSEDSDESTPESFLDSVRSFAKFEPEWCLPFDEPVWRSAAESDFMKPDDPVIGFMTNRGTYAIPWWILKNHHAANLDLDGEELLITLCEACSSASRFDPRLDGERLHFRIVGIYNGTHILGDRETGTYWLSFLGTAQHGPLAGKQLARRRVDQATWADWLEMHPETVVAYREASAREGHGSLDLPGKGGITPFMRKGLRHLDSRVPMHALILGVSVEGDERAYPMKRLTNHGRVVQDELGNRSIVILHKPDTYLAAAFLREINGQNLEFTTNDRQEIVDQQTGSVWDVAGVSRSGPLAGTKLKPVTYIMEEWYAWVAHHPQATLFPHKNKKAANKKAS